MVRGIILQLPMPKFWAHLLRRPGEVIPRSNYQTLDVFFNVVVVTHQNPLSRYQKPRDIPLKGSYRGQLGIG